MTPSRALFLTLVVTFATVANAAGPRSSVRHYGVANGLSNSMVTAIAQDSDGFVWIATNDGLNRFDGDTFRQYDTSNSGLSANELSALTADPRDSGRLWIGTQRNGICVYSFEGDSISHARIPGLLSPDISDISPASDGGLWITHYHFGPQLYNPADGTMRTYDFNSVDGLPRHCWTTAEGKDGRIFVGHAGHGFSVVDTVLRTCRRFDYDPAGNGLPGKSVYSICVDHNGNAWLGTENGAAMYNSATGTVTPFVHTNSDPASIPPGRVRSIAAGPDNAIVFATSQGGVAVLDAKAYLPSAPSRAIFRAIPDPQSDFRLSSRNINSVFADRFGNIWAGHFRAGVDVINHLDPMFSRLPYRSELPGIQSHLPVWSCAVDPDGRRLWIGGEDEIVCYDDGHIRRHSLLAGPSDHHSAVMALLPMPDKVVAGTSEHGVLILDKATGRISPAGGSPMEVRTLVRAPEGRILAGTIEGIYELDGDGMRPLEKCNSRLKDPLVTALCFDRGGNLWVGTFGKGLAVFDSAGALRAEFSLDNGFVSNAINSLRRDSRGRIWAATRNGAVVFTDPADDDTYIPVELPRQPGVSQVMSIEEDSGHNLWMTTARGIVLVNGTTFETSHFADSPETPLSTFVENGSTTDSADNVYFASNDGLVAVASRAIEGRNMEAPVVLSSLTVFSSDGDRETERHMRPNAGKISLAHNENSLAITFNTLDHALARRTEYAYRMEGLDEVWITAGDEHTAVYRNLAPGTYRFMVMSRVSGGKWSAPSRLLTIRVNPPFYRSWWAICLYAALLLGALATALTLYKKRIDQRQRLAAELETHRNNERLNDERLRFYTNITHELRTPLTLILGPLEDMVSDPSLPGQFAYKLRMMRESSKSLLGLIDGILEFRKTETSNRRLVVANGRLGNLVREISLRFKELNHNKAVDYIIDIESDDTPLFFDTEMITIILNNLLSNAAKYTDEGHIKVGYRTEEVDGLRYSRITVEDTGHGISPEAAPHVFERYYRENSASAASGTGIGLSLVKSLVDLHQGDIRVESRPGVGSVFTVSLLTDNTYPEALHADAPPSAMAEADDIAEDAPRRLKMLVVEDNDDIREYIQQALAEEFDVVTAKNGLEGLHAVQRENPDMIISDIMMPEMDGIELCRAVKDDILTSHVPVILLTAKDTMRDKEAGYESGADSYLTKPFSAKLLISRIHNLLRTRRLMARQMLDATMPDDRSEITSPDMNPEIKQEVKTTMSPLDRQFMEKIIAVIYENISLESLGVNLIADKMCMSSSTLYRKIMANAGVSTNEFIRRIRLSRAAEMLLDGKHSITDIAFATGFGSHSSFAKAFKKEFGMTATEYAANHRQEPTE